MSLFHLLYAGDTGTYKEKQGKGGEALGGAQARHGSAQAGYPGCRADRFSTLAVDLQHSL